MKVFPLLDLSTLLVFIYIIILQECFCKKEKYLCGFGKSLSNPLFRKPTCLNSTYCGEWRNNFFYPIGCEYRNISSSDARKCIGNRTIQFIGDSMIRDLGLEVGLFLSDQPWHAK